VLAYLSRYTHRVAISNRRLISADETGVTFKWSDYRIEGPDRYKTMTLPTHEFIRRFLTHVLPKGLHRIRHYGLFANGNRAANIARARELLAVPSLLRWPHDHHRNLRKGLPAETPPRARCSSDQHRHFMMPSPSIHQPSDVTFTILAASASIAAAYRRSINRPAMTPPTLSGNARCARSARHPHPSCEAKQLGRAL
jgi:hypothetical protein